MSPYRQSARMVEEKPKWGFWDWWNCHIRGRHVFGECVINCPLVLCEHRECVHCEEPTEYRHLPQDKPSEKHLIPSLIWLQGCFHQWEAYGPPDQPERDRRHQCTRCPEQRWARWPRDAQASIKSSG